MIYKIKKQQLLEDYGIIQYEFPKYTTQLLNLANQNSQATRPNVVGQMSDLIMQHNGKPIESWSEWYKINIQMQLKMQQIKYIKWCYN